MTDTLYPLIANDWRWNAQAPPPINGQIRTNSQDWSAAATHLYVSYLTDAGVDVSAQLKQIVSGTTLDVAMKTDSTRNVRFRATGAPAMRTEEVETLATTYADIPVTFVTFNGTIPNSGTLCTLTVTIPVTVPLTVTAQLVLKFTGTAQVSTVRPPDEGTTITWKVSVVAGRPNRWLLTVTCKHGSATELCATYGPNQPVPPMYIIEATAQNLVRRNGCTCAGLVAGTTEGADVETVTEAVGL